MRNRLHGGYTIVEALVVVAVTGLIFVSATMLFAGRQQQVQFDQAVKDFESVVRDIMNDVTTGYFASANDIACDVTANISDRPKITEDADSAKGLGENSECIYAGKAIHFVPKDTTKSSFNVYNLIGKRFTREGSFLTADNIAEAMPTPDIDYTVSELSVRYGIEITKVIENTTSASYNEYGVVVLMPNFSGGNVSNASYQAQNLRIHGLWTAGDKLNADKPTAESLINSMQETTASSEGYLDSSAGVVVCLSDNQRKASLTIGGLGSESTLLRIGDVDSKC